MLKFSSYFYINSWRKLLRVAKSLRQISDSNSDDQFSSYRLARKLSFISLGKVSKLSKGLIPELTDHEIDLHVRQKLIITIHHSLLQSLALAIVNPEQKIAISIPGVWRKKLVDEGYKVSNFLSSILWIRLQIYFLLVSIHKTIKLVYFSWNYQHIFPKGKYWVLDGIPLSALHIKPEKNGEGGFFLSKFLLNQMKDMDLDGITLGHIPGSNVHYPTSSIIVSSEPFPPLSSRWKTISYGLECLWIMVRGFISWILGDSHAPIVTLEAISSTYVRKIRHDNLPSWYVTTISFVGYRPAWTLLAEQYGVKVAMAFYTTNNQHQIKGQPLDTPYPGLELMDWPYYLVWDIFQVRWVRSVVRGNPKILELGPIPLSDSNNPLPSIPQGAIAVFDINVLRRGFLAKKGHPNIYYSDELMEQFLSDIVKVIGDLGMVMVLKTKRKIGNLDSVRHRKIMKTLSTKENVIVVNPLINAERVIDKTSATLSIPFTSTGIIANYKGKPSAFYDPSSVLENEENYTHGVDLLQNISDLKLWLSKVKLHQ